MTSKVLICVAAVVVLVIIAEAASPPVKPLRPQCRRYCPNGFLPGRRCACRPFVGLGCAVKRCPPGTKCVLRYGRPTCSKVTSRRVCFQPKKVGPCRAAFTRYFYNRITRKCQKFTFGGCQANQNNFKTLRQCRRTCERK